MTTRITTVCKTGTFTGLKQNGFLMKHFLLILALFFMGSLLQCTSPLGSDQTAWYVKYTLPLLKQKFYVSQLLTDSTIQYDSDTLNQGDTLFFQLTDTFTNYYDEELFNLTDFSESASLGVITLQDLPVLEVPFSIPDYVPFLGDLPGDFPMFTSVYAEVSGIDYITFDTASDSVILSLENRSAGIDFKNLDISITTDFDPPLFLDTVPFIAAGSTVNVKIPMAGRKIGAGYTVTVEATLARGTHINPGDELVFSIDFNGLKIREASAIDSLLDISHTEKVLVPVCEDSFNLAHIDIDYVHLPVTVKNGSQFEFSISARVENLWNADYCNLQSLDSLAEIEDGPLDSIYYLGDALPEYTVAPGDNTPSVPPQHFQFIVDRARLFPVWDFYNQQSYAPVYVTLRVRHEGKKVVVNSETSAAISLTKPSLHFSRILGHYTKIAVTEGELTVIPVLPPEFSEFLRTVRGKLTLQKAEIDFGMEFLIPDSSVLSKVNYMCSLYDPSPGGISDTLRWHTDSVVKNREFSYNFEVGELINTFPDTLAYKVDYYFAPYEPVILCQGLLKSDGGFSYVHLPVKVRQNTVLYGIWGIEDTIRYVFESPITALPISGKQIEALKDKNLEFIFSFINHTNFSGRFFGLAASMEEKDALFALEEDEIGPQVLETEAGKKFIPVLGPKGFILPARNDTSENSIILTRDNIEKLTESDSVFVRWELLLPPTTTDALRDSDYVFVDGKMVIEGAQSTNIFGAGE